MGTRAVISALIAGMLAFAPGASAAGGETAWSGLVIAQNAPEPTPIPAELSRLEGTLKRLFGYNQFQVIGQSRQTLKSGQEDWLASSKYFALHVDSKTAARASYNLHLQLRQEDKLLLETDAKLTKASPIVIKGPQIGDGQLVLLVMLE